ncbi:Uncharacterized protein FWK35_00031319, partial [Aphis craccivora]
MRNKLVAVIIKDQIQNNENLNRTRLIELPKGIEELFPSETEEFGTKRKHLDCNTEFNLNDEDYEDSLIWLRNNIGSDNVLQNLWKKTSGYLLLKDRNINMMTTYLGLTKPTGHILTRHVKTKINSIVNNPNPENIVTDLSLVLNTLETLSNSFDNLKTEYFRLQTLEDLRLLIRPKEIVIGYRLNDHLQDGVVVLDPKPVKIVLTPLRFVLKQLYEHSNFFDVSKYTKELLADDGELIYSINNPLGSHAGNQQLGAVYISLTYLPPELSSSLVHIFLVSLFKADDKKQYGNKKIFKDLISELNFLETVGIDIIDTILLKCLILEHHELYLKLFGIVLKPKHMVHMVSHELKDAADAITSKKMKYTLSLKQQLQLSYRFLSSNENVYTIPIQLGRVITLDSF